MTKDYWLCLELFHHFPWNIRDLLRKSDWFPDEDPKCIWSARLESSCSRGGWYGRVCAHVSWQFFFAICLVRRLSSWQDTSPYWRRGSKIRPGPFFTEIFSKLYFHCWMPFILLKVGYAAPDVTCQWSRHLGFRKFQEIKATLPADPTLKIHIVPNSVVLQQIGSRTAVCLVEKSHSNSPIQRLPPASDLVGQQRSNGWFSRGSSHHGYFRGATCIKSWVCTIIQGCDWLNFASWNAKPNNSETRMCLNPVSYCQHQRQKLSRRRFAISRTCLLSSMWSRQNARSKKIWWFL